MSASRVLRFTGFTDLMMTVVQEAKRAAKSLNGIDFGADKTLSIGAKIWDTKVDGRLKTRMVVNSRGVWGPISDYIVKSVGR